MTEWLKDHFVVIDNDVSWVWHDGHISKLYEDFLIEAFSNSVVRIT